MYIENSVAFTLLRTIRFGKCTSNHSKNDEFRDEAFLYKWSRRRYLSAGSADVKAMRKDPCSILARAREVSNGVTKVALSSGLKSHGRGSTVKHAGLN